MGLSSISAAVGLLILICGIYLFKKGQQRKVAVALLIIGILIAMAPVTLIYLLLD